VNLKVEGKEITSVTPQVQRAQVIDLMEALKESLAKRIPEQKRVAAKARRPEVPPAKKAQATKK
jgi:non-homologous end joining protein Ku